MGVVSETSIAGNIGECCCDVLQVPLVTVREWWDPKGCLGNWNVRIFYYKDFY